MNKAIFKGLVFSLLGVVATLFVVECTNVLKASAKPETVELQRLVVVESHGDYELRRDTLTGRIYYRAWNGYLVEIDQTRLNGSTNDGPSASWNPKTQDFTPIPGVRRKNND